MSPEDLQAQLGRSATVERELCDRIRDLEQTVSTQAESLRAAMGQVEEAKSAAARTFYERAIAVSEVLAKMQAENTRLETMATERLDELQDTSKRLAAAQAENTRLEGWNEWADPMLRSAASMLATAERAHVGANPGHVCGCAMCLRVRDWLVLWKARPREQATSDKPALRQPAGRRSDG